MSYADVAGLTVAQFLNAAHSGKPPAPSYRFESFEDYAEWRMEL